MGRYTSSSKHRRQPTWSRGRHRVMGRRLRKSVCSVRTLTILAVAIPPGLLAYAYVVYPLLLRFLARRTRPSKDHGVPSEWPFITLTLPVYNAAASISGAIESLLALDYPSERREIVVVSDASTDGTDAVVECFADRGVQLLRLPERGGKTAAENFAATRVRGDIVVCTDATIRIPPEALKP
ncbi:MAG: glycosyltransferase, partial [Gemmatimonadales bacterium]